MNYTKNKRMKMIVLTIFLLGWLGGWSVNIGVPGAGSEKYGKKEALTPEDQLLNATFRIDISTIRVTFDYYPDQYLLKGVAEVIFKMRPGQSRPLIHFDLPALHSGSAMDIRLNGEALDPGNSADIVILSYPETTQKAIEFQRNLAANVDHRLQITYEKNLPQGYPMFATQVTDLYGWGNEEIFPTINTPHELALHVLTIRVHSGASYRCVGSGWVRRTARTDVQEWILTSEREIASYTLMFVVVPEEDTYIEEEEIDGISVRIVAYQGGASISDAMAQLKVLLPVLQEKLGPFPMPRGISIFLVSGGGGMEYYGGTITSLWALNHEVFHMYFGCSTVMKTYRDSWLDEAITSWYDDSMDPNFPAISPDYRSNIVSGRSAIAVAFDRRAYNEGAQMIQYIAQALGGRSAMIKFLKYVHSTYNFTPFTTIDFINYLRDYANIDLMDQFINWVFDGQAGGGSRNFSRVNRLNRVDIRPPVGILKRYVNREIER